MPRVLVTDPLAAEGIARLREAAVVDVRTGLTPDELVQVIEDYDALVVRSETRVTAEVLAAGSRLRVVGRAGVGVDNIDVEAATVRGVLVVNSPEGNTVAAAELSVAMLLSLARQIPQAAASLREGRWERKRFVGAELYGKTLGIMGLGKIGAEVARRARGFEMRVIAYDPYATEEKASDLGVTLAAPEEVYANADFITIHVPLNAETRGMVGPEQIAAMRDGVRIVNCARGGIVDEHALAEAVASGKVAGVAFDVFTQEPPPPEHPLFSAPQNVLTPHLGASTEEAQVAVAVDVAAQVIDVLAGRPARAAVNMPALTLDVMRLARPWLQLARKIGSLHTQLGRPRQGEYAPVQSVEVLFHGDFGDIPPGPVTRAVLAGLLEPVLSDPVNLVNAHVLAASRGIRVVESQTTEHSEYSTVLTVTARTRSGEREICGTVFGVNDVRIVHIDGFRVDLVPTGAMLVTQHSDRPGVIGAVGTILGDHGVNIAGMSVGREAEGGLALMVLAVDEPLSAALLAQVQAVPGMETAQLVEL